MTNLVDRLTSLSPSLPQTWGKSTRYPEARLFNYYRDLPLPAEEKNRVEAPEVVLTVTVLRSVNFYEASVG